MIRRLALPLLVFTATLLPAAPAVPLVNLVDDQTLFALSITDAPALVRGWESSPLITTWNDPQFVKFLAPLRKELHVEEWDADTRAATGLSVRELLALAEGEVLFAVPNYDFTKFDSKRAPAFVVAIEVGGQGEKIEKILTDSAEKESLKQEVETFAGVNVTIRPLPKTETADEEEDDSDDAAETEAAAKAAVERTISWAIVDGVWLISSDKERVFAAIDAVKQGGVDAALGKNERFLRTRERVGKAQSLIYVNTPAIYPLVRDAVRVAKTKSAGALNSLGLDTEVVFNALGMDAVGEGYMSLLIDEKETRIDMGLVYSDERGLLKLVAYQPGPAVQPDWIPGKWASVSTARFSMLKAYEGLEELLVAVSPMLSALADGKIRSINKQLNVDLKRDFIGSFGDDLISAYAIPPGFDPGVVPQLSEMDQFVSLSLANEPAFIKAMDALMKNLGPAAEKLFIKRDYLGHTIYTFNAPTPPGAKPPRGFSYAIANGTLMLGIGSAATVENALQGMASGEGLFWKRDEVKAALADLPADAVAFQIQDLRVMIASLIETAVQAQELINASNSEEGKTIFVDVSTRPDADAIARHWSFSSGHATRTPDGIFSTTRLAHPQK
jgi:hypothetical protein